jgi:hypothetical protein
MLPALAWDLMHAVNAQSVPQAHVLAYIHAGIRRPQEPVGLARR